MSIDLSPDKKSAVIGRLLYIHNNTLPLYAGILKWFTDCLYTEFNFKSISTYEKFIKEINDEQALQDNNPDQNTIYKPILPAISLDPLGELTVDEKWSQLWHFQYCEGGADFANTLFASGTSLKSDNFRLTIIPTRFAGTMDVIIVCDSITKLIDLRFQTIMFFNGGFNRPIRPSFIESDLILPNELMDGVFYNNTPENITNENINFDAPNTIESKVVKSLGGNSFYYLPYLLDPQIRLQSITDSSEKYGGTDLAKWSLTFSFSYEVNLPTFFYLESDWKLENIEKKIMATNDSVLINKSSNVYKENIDNNNPAFYVPENWINVKCDGISDYIKRHRTYTYVSDTDYSIGKDFTFLVDDNITDWNELVILSSLVNTPLVLHDDYEVINNIVKVSKSIQQYEKLFFHVYKKNN